MARTLNEILEHVPAGVLLRRTFLGWMGGTAAAYGVGRLFGGLPGALAANAGGPLALFTWQGYDLTDPFKKWRAEHGIEQTQKYINNQFDVVSILKGPGGRDFEFELRQPGLHASLPEARPDHADLGVGCPLACKDVSVLSVKPDLAHGCRRRHLQFRPLDLGRDRHQLPD